ncbi:MAG: thioredoxin domain-containing protein, partial [Candidatus Dormibacteraeota bacterium]|nr:thioredoxin domain-containing protein [Candidatus Dormibacteraeota bacterium]
MPNRLAGETSPYLLQHRDNPVDWYPWGEEALRRARDDDRPILLSIGYSACHWCHVMERESFEDPATAARMNRGFVCVKVDREERPDLDSIYMSAVQQLTGSGGWPMTVFLTPDLRPFFGGTYFPPEARYGMPGFTQVLEAVLDAFQTRREDVERSAGELTESISSGLSGRPGSVDRG